MSSGNGNGTSLLRQRLEEACEAAGGVPLKDLTVLAQQNDPFRTDTPARHRDGEWLAIQAEELGYGSRRIHLRGLHYAIAQADQAILKPDGDDPPGGPYTHGEPYRNVDADWHWLVNNAGKAARWLGYIPFDRITDERNAEPVEQEWEPRPAPEPYLSCGVRVEVYEHVEPKVQLDFFNGRQPFRLVLFGEKASLEGVLGPVARRYGADLYLPTGEISDTLLYRMARRGAEDGRPMVVVTFSDCDPSGWQMPISIARKLQALQALRFEGLEFRVFRAGLTPDQVREHGLPSRPLKGTERRADRWTEAMGVEQTEVDALTTPRTERLLRRMAEQAVSPFYDNTLTSRVARAKQEWEERAQAFVDETAGHSDLEAIRARARAKLAELEDEVEQINDALRFSADLFNLPDVPEIPEPETNGHHGHPLIDSSWTFEEQTRALIASKSYQEEHEPTEEELRP